MDKNQKIQEISMYFKVGLNPFPLPHCRFQFDTNRINARGNENYMKQLEEWAHKDIITLYFSDTVLRELQKYTPGLKKTSGKLFTMSFSEDEQRVPFKMIENILFPDGCKNENQMNDVRIVFHAYKHHYIFITNEGDSKSQPTGILGNASILKTQLNITVMRDSEAVKMVQSEIDKLNELAREYSKKTGTPLLLFD
jgi:hypothetical protein